MSQISNIRGTSFVQSAESSQVQTSRPVAPHFRTPAALLARLSGVGKITSPFKLSLVGKNSCLARLSEQFARRPLGDTPEGRLASEMLALADSLAVGSLSASDLTQLDALRSKAEKGGMSDDARDFCNALARSVMLHPLTEAAAGLDSKVMRTYLAESLHGLLDHLFNASDEYSFWQAGTELSGLKETFRMLGILGADQQAMFDHLEGVLSFRQSISDGLDALAADVDKVVQGQMPGRTIDECLTSANELCRKLRFDPDAPAMARMGAGPMDARAQSIITELGLSITQKATAIASRMAELATAARTAGTDLAALASDIAAVKDELSAKAAFLSSSHFGVLQGMGDSLEGALLTGRLLSEADALLAKDDVSPEELHAKGEEFSAALEKPGLDSDDEARLNAGNDKLNGRLSQISKEHLDKLSGILISKEKDIKASSTPSEIRLDIEAWTNEAETFLLRDDKVTFEARLAGLVQEQADTIYATVALQLKGEAFDALNESHRATLKEFCLSAGCHPSLIRMLKSLDATALRGLLFSFQNIQNSRASGTAPQNDDIRSVDARLLPYPELDDVASALLRKNDPAGEPDYRFDSTRMLRDLKTYMEKNFSSALLRNVSLPGTDVSDISFLAEVVACAAKARLVDKAQLQQVDFSLIQALWFCSKASDASLDFTEFKGRLPEPYRSMPLLKEYMDAGISGRRALRSLDHSLTLSSQGMGTRWALMGFLTEAQAQNIKWSAGLGIKALYKDLGLKEFEALEGRFKDVLKGDELAEAKDAVAGVYAGTADRLLNKAEAFKEQERILTENELRGIMAARIGWDPKSAKSLEKGSTLAGYILLLDNILNSSSIDLTSQQAIVMAMASPKSTSAEGAKALLASSRSGDTFITLMKAMLGSYRKDKKVYGGENFMEARQKLLDLMKEQKLVEKAEAVLYFKEFGERSHVAGVTEKIWEPVRVTAGMTWRDDDPLRAICNQAEKTILQNLTAHGVTAGAGSTQNLEIKKAQANAAHVDKEVSKVLKNSVDSSFEQARRERITKIVSLAVCEQITLNAELNTLDDLKNAIDTHKTDLENWPFYQATYKRLCAMGLPEGTAKLYLRSFLTTVDRDFFVDLAKSGQKGTNTKDRIYSLVSAQMTELRDHGKTLTLSTSAEGTLSLVAGAAGVADVGVIIKSARENGLTAWKDTDGTYHMTVMDGVKGGVTAEIAAEFKNLIKTVSLEAGVRAEAGVDGNFSHGCDLIFPNATQCQMFLFAILSRQTSPELFGLCKEASLVTEGGIGAHVNLSAKASVTIGEDEDALLATELGAGAEGSIKWSKTVNGEHTQRSRTVTGSVALKAEASLNLGVLDANVNSFAETLKDKVEGKIDDTLSTGLPESVTNTVKEKVGDLADAASGKALDVFSSAMDEVKKKGEDGVLTVEKSCVFSYEETRTITERNSLTSDGRRVLESYERVRAFTPENKAEALDLMRQHNVSPACMSAVLEYLKDMPANEGFRLELVSNMKAASIRDYNANRATKPGAGSFELTELRVITEEVYEKDRGLERGPVNVNVHRGFTRTQTESFAPRLGA